MDDNLVVQQLYKRKLETLGYVVVTALDGAGAVLQSTAAIIATLAGYPPITPATPA